LTLRPNNAACLRLFATNLYLVNIMQAFEFKDWYKRLLLAEDEITAMFLEILCDKEVTFTNDNHNYFLPPCKASLFFVSSPSNSRWNSLRHSQSQRKLIQVTQIVDQKTPRTNLATNYGMNNYVRMSSRMTLYRPREILIFMHSFPDDARMDRLRYFRKQMGLQYMHPRIVMYNLSQLYEKRTSPLPQRIPSLL